MIVLGERKRKEGIGCHNRGFFDNDFGAIQTRYAKNVHKMWIKMEEGMYHQIERILLQYGYEEIALNAADIHLALRQEQGEGYAVVTLDETGGNSLSAEQFYHVSEQIRAFLAGRGCSHCRFLYLLLSEDDGSTRRLFHNYESFWRIVPSRRQVMVFEDVEEAFMVLRAPLENLFQKSYPEPVRGRRLPWVNISVILINVVIFLYTDFFAVFSGAEAMEAGALG